MTEIPEEYTNADYGFSAIDEATYKAQQTVNEETPPSIDENDLNRVVLNALSPIEDKLDSLIKKRQISENDDVQLAIAKAQSEAIEKVTELEKIIMPLLVNLLKTKEKEYIHWPNRGPQVQASIDKVLAITRG